MGSSGIAKLTQGHGLALYKLGSAGQEYVVSSHFELNSEVYTALYTHFLSKNKLNCMVNPWEIFPLS